MGLTSSLLIGQRALSASQIALQVTGNNIANVATPGYHRQSAVLAPSRGQQIGPHTFVGSGVQINDIRRAVDEALQARLRASISDEQAAVVNQNILLQLESLTNELTGIDLSSELTRFFNAFSDLANSPTATVTRSAVVENGATLAAYIRGVRSDLLDLRSQIDTQLEQHVTRADELLNEIASINVAIVNAEQGRATEGTLRDQRDQLVAELSGLIDVSVVEQASGAIDVFVGSQPIVLAGDNRGLELHTTSEDGELIVEVLISSRQEKIEIEGGKIGGLLSQRSAAIQQTIDDLDEISATLIFEVNKLHVVGRSLTKLTDLRGSLAVPVADQTLSFNDPTNETFAELPYTPRNGSIEVVVTDQNGNKTTTTIQIDLDGIDLTGAVGFADDTSLSDVQAALDAIPNLNAQITANGELRIFTDSGYDVHFASDTSGVLATLGINTYFTGQDGSDIAVREDLRADSLKLVVGFQDGTNETALAIAGLRELGIESLGGDSIANRWLKSVERTAVQTRAAGTRAEALQTVRQSLEAQEAAVSGVSLDEESINLINYQQQYSGAARFVSVINELTTILINLV